MFKKEMMTLFWLSSSVLDGCFEQLFSDLAHLRQTSLEARSQSVDPGQRNDNGQDQDWRKVESIPAQLSSANFCRSRDFFILTRLPGRKKSLFEKNTTQFFKVATYLKPS